MHETLRRTACIVPDVMFTDGNFRIDTDLPRRISSRRRALVQHRRGEHPCKGVPRRALCEYDKLYPQYGFAKHKGYGTAAHIAAIGEYGLCEIHRRTFTKKLSAGRGAARRKVPEKRGLQVAARILRRPRRGGHRGKGRETIVFCEVKARLSEAFGTPPKRWNTTSGSAIKDRALYES